MPSYESRSSYQPDRDVRDWDHLLDHIEHREPAGVFWPIVGPRRSGKTWALQALAARVTRATHYQLLSRLYAAHGPGLDSMADAFTNEHILLLDEPGFALFRPSPDDEQTYAPDDPRDDIEAFIQALARLHGRGVRIVMALTPAEWRAFLRADRGRGHVSTHDISPALGPLTREQALRIAQDADARALVGRLPATWTRSPFLLTWLLHQAFVACMPHDDLREFLRGFIHFALEDNVIRYVDRVFEEGLDATLRDALRSVGRTGKADAEPLAILRDAGLVAKADDGHHDIADPILAHHLPPPFRIHHVSDLHFGPKSATMVDDKLGGALGTTLVRAAGQRLAQDAYLEHVESLPRHARPHLVVVSGDVTEMGRDEEYAQARAWLLRLVACLAPHPRSRPRDPRVMIVGGNHDVDWTETRAAAGARKRHLPFVRALEGIDGVAVAKLADPPGEGRPPTRHRFVDVDVDIVLLGSAEHGGELDTDILALTERLRQQAVAAFDQEGEAKASLLRKRYGQLDPGLVHGEDLRHLRRMELQGAIGIAVLHHPVSPLPASAELAPLGGLLNAGQLKDALLYAGFHFVLHGHAHSAWLCAERWPGRHHDRTLHIVAAPTLSSFETVESHGFNELCVHLEDDGARVDVTLYERKGDSFHMAHEAKTLVTTGAAAR